MITGKKMVAEADRMSQKEEATFRSQWLHGETAYRRMVEPLNIADYYSKGYKDYITKGRSQHYIKLEKWLEEGRNPTNKPRKWKTENVFASLTEDSCFWAHVEEALSLCKSLRNGEEGELTRENLVKFEEYVMEHIKNYAVSPEILLTGSSFMQWWREYEEIMGTNYNSELNTFMKNSIYHQYANGSLIFR
ncbi:hypothetical protein Dsin_007395 [Dipteronia sinensis]|uniref:EDS1 EP domain-containing protein n=1 Tax=Dipteronia sinensis TaxID=43782 RepID=A0AAE0B029_9ROSI|nr:hypothetical protein Dsin_007395 [Dipteronia sinensis]